MSFGVPFHATLSTQKDSIKRHVGDILLLTIRQHRITYGRYSCLEMMTLESAIPLPRCHVLVVQKFWQLQKKLLIVLNVTIIVVLLLKTNVIRKL